MTPEEREALRAHARLYSAFQRLSSEQILWLLDQADKVERLEGERCGLCRAVCEHDEEQRSYCD